jgi:hypothetical protein
MRLPILLFCGGVLTGTGWRIGTRCGDILVDTYVEVLENLAAKRLKKKTKLSSVA